MCEKKKEIYVRRRKDFLDVNQILTLMMKLPKLEITSEKLQT